MKITSENRDEVIEKYLDGYLTAEELKEFEEQLKADRGLSEALNFRKTIGESWKNALKYDRTKYEVRVAIEKTARDKRILVYRFAAAAVITGLILFTGGIFIFQNTPDYFKFAKRQGNSDQISGPQFNEQEEKASFGKLDSLIFVSPMLEKPLTNSDSVIFCWKPGLPSSSYIVIKSVKNNEVIFKEKIIQGRHFFYLENNFLPPGEYWWYVEGYKTKGYFKIVR
jgi:hypothetical protein